MKNMGVKQYEIWDIWVLNNMKYERCMLSNMRDRDVKEYEIWEIWVLSNMKYERYEC